jgi:hypothetical protein
LARQTLGARVLALGPPPDSGAARRGLKDHPTAKPTAMLEDALPDLTDRGDSVIDPFLGSRSTLIAADKIGGVCRGVELDSLYFDVIMRRYAAATGNTAVPIETGEAFDALARVGQGRQRRSVAGSQRRALGSINPWKRRRRQRASVPYRGGQRFESPQLHQEVRANRRDFLRHRIARHFRSLPR